MKLPTRINVVLRLRMLTALPQHTHTASCMVPMHKDKPITFTFYYTTNVPSIFLLNHTQNEKQVFIGKTIYIHHMAN
jgi:hypothetical protein